MATTYPYGVELEKFAVSAISEGLRQEVGDKLRVTSI
jgi:NADP-dependent 3-hydroxy acid dehydrogenase YdfG